VAAATSSKGSSDALSTMCWCCRSSRFGRQHGHRPAGSAHGVGGTLIGSVAAVVAANYRDLFVVIGTCAATLIGLLFVAISVTEEATSARPQEIREFRAAAALLAFTNAFIVSLFGLVPGTNIGYPATVVGAVGLLFTAGGVRTIVSLQLSRRQSRSQVTLLVILLTVFGVQLGRGIQLLVDRRNAGAVAFVGDILIVSLLVGIGRAWEFVGQWDTGVVASIGRLIRHPEQEREAEGDDRRAPPGTDP
jgi:hypothetical protein